MSDRLEHRNFLIPKIGCAKKRNKSTTKFLRQTWHCFFVGKPESSNGSLGLRLSLWWTIIDVATYVDSSEERAWQKPNEWCLRPRLHSIWTHQNRTEIINSWDYLSRYFARKTFAYTKLLSFLSRNSFISFLTRRSGRIMNGTQWDAQCWPYNLSLPFNGSTYYGYQRSFFFAFVRRFSLHVWDAFSGGGCGMRTCFGGIIGRWRLIEIYFEFLICFNDQAVNIPCEAGCNNKSLN